MKQRIKNAMITALSHGECRDGIGAISYTALAETAAFDCDHTEWLDDPNHIVWDLAVEIADGWNTEVK